MKSILKAAFVGAMALVYSFANAQETQDQSATPSSSTVQTTPTQTSPTQTTPTQTTPSQTTPTKSLNYVVLEKGKLMEYKDGKAIEVKSDFLASNGDKVSAAGLITMKDGTTRQLKEGDRFYKDGRVEASAPSPKQEN